MIGRQGWIGMVAVVVACLGTDAQAVSEEASFTGALLNVPLSVRQMGMGNVSVGGTDLMRAWSNPAMVAGQPGGGELALNGGALFTNTAMFGLASTRTGEITGPTRYFHRSDSSS